MFPSIHPIPLALAVLSALLVVFEHWRGAALTVELRWKGDLKRETRWFAQYGQMGCTLVVAALLACFDLRHRTIDPWLMVIITVFTTSFLGTLIKRTVGRVRPGHEQAGRFLGPSWKHDSTRESFPSTHTACAVAMSFVLANYYPQGTPVFCVLAAACGVLRYLLDAHWPSDVVAGAALGWAVGAGCWYLLPVN